MCCRNLRDANARPDSWKRVGSCGWQYFIPENWALTWMHKNSVMLTSYQNIHSTFVCGEVFKWEMIRKREGFSMQRHDDPRDLVAELLRAVYGGGEVDPFLHQWRTADQRSWQSKRHKAGPSHKCNLQTPTIGILWCQFCHPKAESYRNIEPQEI